MAFPSALSGESDSEEEGAVLSDGALFAILVGLFILLGVYIFFMMKEKDNRRIIEAAKIAERTMQDIGLDKDNLLDDKNMEVLRSHPRELETLRYILDRENLIPAA